MKDQVIEVADDPKVALVDFILDLENNYYPWYESAATRNYYAWFIAQAVSLLAGFATAVLAAFVHGEQLNTWGVRRGILIVLPLLGSLASTYLLQSNVAEMEDHRETGRETIQTLVNEARVDFAAAKSPENYTRIHRALAAKVSALEKQQRRGFRRIVPKVVSFSAPANKEHKNSGVSQNDKYR